MGFDVHKVDYVNGSVKEPPFVEVQTEIGKIKVEASIFKGLVNGKKEGDMPLGVELTNGIKIRDLNSIYTPNGEVTIYDMPISGSPKPNSNVCVYAKDATVLVDSANKEYNSVEIHNKNGLVHAYRDPDDHVSFYAENEQFLISQCPR